MKFAGCSTGIPGDGSPSGCLRVEVETSPATRREAAEAAGPWEISGILRISVKCFFLLQDFVKCLSNVLDGEGDVQYLQQLRLRKRSEPCWQVVVLAPYRCIFS